MPISEFKAKALRTIDRVAESRLPVLITRRGRPLARVVPYDGPEAASRPGRLASALVFEGDLVSPLGAAAWDAAR
jgi:prevent-host-death family protein